MFAILFVLGIGLIAAFWLLPRGRRDGVTSTDPGGTFSDGGAGGGADCSSPSDAGCGDGGGDGGGGDGGGGGGD